MLAHPLSTRRALIIGHLVVNGPVLAIILAGAYVGRVLASGAGRGTALGGMVGAIVAWPWWSLAVPRWRAWALAHGANPDELQRFGVMTGLLWRKGSMFERTELPPHDRNRDRGAA